MIKEAIAFVEKFESDTTKQENREDWIGKKFIVVNVNENISYDGYNELENDQQVKEWLEKHPPYKIILDKIDHYILPGPINSALGSSSGLATYSFFAFRLSKAILDSLKLKPDEDRSFKDKAIQTKFNDEELDNSILIDQIHNVWFRFKDDLDTHKD